jgi:hypothetical protein
MRGRKLQAIRIHDTVAAMREVFGDQLFELGSDLQLPKFTRVHARLKRDTGNAVVLPLVLLKFSLHFDPQTRIGHGILYEIYYRLGVLPAQLKVRPWNLGKSEPQNSKFDTAAATHAIVHSMNSMKVLRVLQLCHVYKA